MISQGMRFFVAASMVAGGLYVFAVAPRKVTIPTTSNSTNSGLDLLNGSTVNVSYRLQCFDKTGASVYTKTNQTLTPKQQRHHGSMSTCGYGVTPSFGTNGYNGMVQCMRWDSFSEAANTCGSSYTVCTHSEFLAKKSGFTGTSWVNFGGALGSATNSWSRQWSGMGWINNSAGEVGIASTDNNSECNTAPSGGGSSVSFCSGVGGTSSNYTFCCPTAGTEVPADSCTVEIESTTSADGYLQSPQFKGGAAF